ncbi:acyloxyacyl hydrolase [Fulvivirga sedimenti]|uniref:Acyloxyacyl hydrolase n=1 Tax=Fulvivirga sedimenti TaxID=2879465 RepID=A0A9X1L003_9BACT|nr:acyloxyacyl hydrolase [Fulvivirga sedimenti]MCA6075565.1 acyloxyacyl hydrolase [Fulvivirga sedimenti]MCA6076742.1 acyloxyacyl hydrolase [Fulvivirga sedimenti]MCA6077870.1 acyloxyacyl hydrolase [Fulvivirga sedimenti]
MKKIVSILLLLMVVLTTSSLAQRQKSFGLAYRNGWLLKHHEELRTAFVDAHPVGFEFTYLSKTTGDDEWERVWNYPDIGISLAYLNYGDSRLGQALVTSFFIQKYIGNPDNRLRFSFKIAPGVSFSDEKYDPETNPENTFISTTINGVMEGNFLAHYQLTPHMAVNGGIVFTHYSNGAVQVPNSGFNIPSLTVGMLYTPNPDQYKRNTDPVGAFQRRTRFSVQFAPSVKAYNEEDPKKYFAFTASVNAIRYLNHKVALNGSADVFYNSSIPDRTGDPGANRFRLGLALGPELTTGPNSVVFQLGYYVYRPEEVDKSFYWRIGIKHHFTDHFFTGFALKAHLGKADVIEWGVGYRL